MSWAWVGETQFTPQHLGLPPSDHLTMGCGRSGWAVHISVFQGQLLWSYYLLCFLLSFYCSFSYIDLSVIDILVYFIISYFAGNPFFNWFLLLEMPHKRSYYSVSKRGYWYDLQSHRSQCLSLTHTYEAAGCDTVSSVSYCVCFYSSQHSLL